MARVRISEYRAKKILYRAFADSYTGIQVNNNSLLHNLEPRNKYVVKVDQGVKGRFKKGLVALNVKAEQISNVIKEFQDEGYSQFLIEKMHEYSIDLERYLAIERIREGYKIIHSEKGGVNIEQNPQSIKQLIVPYNDLNSNDLNSLLVDIPTEFIKKILDVFDKFYFSFLEINPYIIIDNKLHILDAAIEVDSTAEFFVDGVWTSADYTDQGPREKSTEEKNIKLLCSNSQAAFSLEVLNHDGGIFMLLSGGGASIVLADEAANLGYGKFLANYGEYSGNPNAEESYIYAKNIISLLFKSKASKKVMIIAGGVANFTDVRITFKGLIKALDEYKTELKSQKIKVYVRRGGPFQKEGLELMQTFLRKEDLLGIVAGPEMVLTDIVSAAISKIKD